MDGEVNGRSLIRSAILDHGHLVALQRLIFGPLSPDDLPLVEQSLRAFITVEQLRPLPIIAAEMGDDFDKDIPDEESGEAPIGDHVLDYEFIYEPTWVPILPAI